jgi:hypothetical protein
VHEHPPLVALEIAPRASKRLCAGSRGFSAYASRYRENHSKVFVS